MIPSRFLFRMAIPCLSIDAPAKKQELPEKYVFPEFGFLETSAGEPTQKSPLEVRGAWHADGLLFQFRVTGKKKPVWCMEHQPMLSDRVELWLDTRDVRNVHRATRFCHRFLLMPGGGGRDGEEPVFHAPPINRAKETPNDIPRGSVSLTTKPVPGGYSLTLWLPSKSLTGYYPDEFPRLGIAWALYDRELGEITLTAGAPFAFQEDPSLWFTMELVK